MALKEELFPTLRKYDAEGDHICTQCKGTRVSLVYKDCRSNFELDTIETHVREAMHITCKNCGYDWYEWISIEKSCSTY